MITGDYHHTAIAVAKDVGVVRSDGQVMIIDIAKEGSNTVVPVAEEQTLESQLSMTENTALLQHASTLAKLVGAHQVPLTG